MILSNPEIRRLYDMRAVVCDKDWAKKAPNHELYYMYRGLKKKDSLRYDITVIPSRMLGCEFVKTKGHSHTEKDELYEILAGEAIYLMQSPENVYAVEASKGEFVIIPHGYGHVTINPGTQELKMANWISEDCKSDYLPIENKQGACYFYTKEGWIKNKNYKNIPNLHFEKPLKKIPKNLDFLK